MSDLISRQKILATLDNADKFLDEERTVETYKELLTECIKVLPLAGSDGDLISRQAVENITWEEPSYTDPLNVLTEVREKVRALPSVENKGEWIPILSINEIPKEGAYWVTFEYENGYRETSYIGWDKFHGRWDDEEGWALDNGDCIIAYMPYFEPKPYSPKSE